MQTETRCNLCILLEQCRPKGNLARQESGKREKLAKFLLFPVAVLFDWPTWVAQWRIESSFAGRRTLVIFHDAST